MGVASGPPSPPPGVAAPGLWQRCVQFLRHFWMDEDDARRAVPAALAQSLAERIAQGERRHGAELRLCVEASLPWGLAWQLLRGDAQAAVVRQRALDVFSEMRVWDTEHNSGLLIYVLLAEHAIEVVADRGLGRIPAEEWQALARALAEAFRAGRQAQGLPEALDRARRLLEEAGLAAEGPNELPDAPLLR